MKLTTQLLLEEALLHIKKVEKYAEQSTESEIVVDAIALRLQAAIDTLKRLPGDMREEISDGAWEAMWGMRNRITHGYMTVNPEVIRLTVQYDLQPLKERIIQYLGSSD